MSPKDLTYDIPEAEKFIDKETQRMLRLGKVKVHSTRNVGLFIWRLHLTHALELKANEEISSTSN